MAAEYEVNIKLNTQQVEKQLKSIDTRTKRTGRMATENINTLAKAQDRRARLMIKINELEAKGLNVAKLRKQMGKATEELSRRRFGSLQQEFRLLTRTLRLEESKLRILRQQQQGFPSSPLRGTATMAGSPAQIAASARAGGPRSPIRGAANIAGSPEARRAARQRLEQVGLGAGFPLLFGGGAGSVLGGAVGGLTGSFGAQIAFSAIGQQIDQFITSVAEAGRAFGSLEGVLDLMSERSLFTSKSSEELAEQLQELGDVEALAELATIELASKIGSEGIGAFQDLETELDEFDRLVGHLMISLQAFLAGPLGGFLEIVNAVLGKKVTQGTVNRLAGSLQDPADQARFRAAAKQRIGTEIEFQGFGMGGLPKSAEVLKSAPLDLLSELSREVARGEFGESNLLSRPVRITRQDRESLKPGREAAQLQKRLDRLDAERQKVLDISSLQDKIAAAEQAKDQFLVIRLKGEQKLKDIEAKRLKDLAGITKQSEIRKINELAAAKVIAAQADTAREINQLEFERQERFEDTIENLDYQLKIAEATTREEKERLRIEQEIKKLRDSGQFSESQLADIQLRMEQLSDQNSPLNKFIQQTKEQIQQLNDPIFQVIELSKTLGDAFSQSFRGIIDGSMTAQEALANLFRRTADHFLDMAAQMIAAQIRMQAVNLFMSFLGGSSGGGGGGTTPPTTMPDGVGAIAANGLAFNRNGVIPFAKGGVVNKPTLFPFANGTGLMGEAGPEAIMPLRRGPSGRLGVEALGGGAGATNIVVNVDSSGSSVECSADQAQQLGKAIGIAVQQELVKQKRPGGLLAS